MFPGWYSPNIAVDRMSYNLIKNYERCQRNGINVFNARNRALSALPSAVLEPHRSGSGTRGELLSLYSTPHENSLSLRSCTDCRLLWKQDDATSSVLWATFRQMISNKTITKYLTKSDRLNSVLRK